MSTEKIKRFLQNEKKLMASGIALFLIVSTIFTCSFVFSSETKAVALVVDGDKDVYETAAITVQGFLDEQNIEVEPHDKVSVPMGSFISDDQTIEIESGVPMTIIDNGETYNVMAAPGTVEEVLEFTGHQADENDRISLALTDEVNQGAVIIINRIDYKQETVTETDEINVVKKYDNSMPAGTTKVLQTGVCGVYDVVYEYCYKNGVKVNSTEISRQVVQEPQDKIVLVGSKVATPVYGDASIAAPVAGEYTKCFTVSATAYTHTGNRTASGTIARVGVIAVDPKVIPMGTKVYVEGYGYAIAEDTGGAIKGNKIDIFLDTRGECINWGRRNVTIYILN